MAENNSMKRHLSANDAEPDIDFALLLAVLVEHWLLIASTAVVAMLAAISYVMFATPIYKGDALLQVEQKSSGVPGLSELNQMFEQESSTAAEIEILRSRMILREVISQLKMDIQVQPERNSLWGKMTAPDPAPPFLPRPAFAGYRDSETFIKVSAFNVPDRLLGRSFKIIEEKGQPALYFEGGLVGTAPLGKPIVSEDGSVRLFITDWVFGGEPVLITRLPEIAAINRLRGMLSVQEIGKTGMLSMTATGPDKQQIKAVLDTISNVYVLQNIERRSAEAENSLAFLGKQLPEIKEKLTAAEEKLNAYRLESESVDLTMETQSVLERSVGLEAKINELKIQEGEIASRFTREHPTYQTLIRQRRSLVEEKNQLDQQIKDLPKTQQEILRLMRDVEVTQQIYVGLLNKTQELRILKAGTVGSVRIIDEALVQPAPIKPKKSLVVIIATMLGAGAAAGLVLMRSLLSKGIESPEKLEEQGVSVYAAIPLSEHQQKAERMSSLVKRRKSSKGLHSIPLLADIDPNDLAIEALRSLRTSLHFAMMDASNNILMVAGPSPGVGKSFVSANLAAVLAKAGQKILVIDADMRKGHLHRFFARSHEIGLSGYLSGQHTKEEIILATEDDNLHLIPRGKAPPNPSELLMHARFSNLMEELSDEYDLVLIDTPPILAVTDSAIIGQLAGSSLLVTRYGVNSVKEVDAALTRFAQNNVEIKGAILNCMERRATNEYSYYAYEYSKSND